MQGESGLELAPCWIASQRPLRPPAWSSWLFEKLKERSARWIYVTFSEELNGTKIQTTDFRFSIRSHDMEMVRESHHFLGQIFVAFCPTKGNPGRRQKFSKR